MLVGRTKGGDTQTQESCSTREKLFCARSRAPSRPKSQHPPLLFTSSRRGQPPPSLAFLRPATLPPSLLGRSRPQHIIRQTAILRLGFVVSDFFLL
ncbi:hypothetical protein SLEP1_g42984 [Rubroshorea leprosula]|uniref:Uncharacterized protein n=1 Tax=Rubroshorea leprosula TaxID=152421 RepID=A0AAV5LBZ0_9ROSI|nr:hypothetical protein SLEP1_g42984 [Rubroshorea leprosula]